MFKLLHSLTIAEFFRHQLPAFGLALLTAELFYKFHSFTIECIAFLATWYVVDGVLQWLHSSVHRCEHGKLRTVLPGVQRPEPEYPHDQER